MGKVERTNVGHRKGFARGQMVSLSQFLNFQAYGHSGLSKEAKGLFVERKVITLG